MTCIEGNARRAPAPSPLPRQEGPVRPAHHPEQRGDLRQNPPDHSEGRRLVPQHGHREEPRHQRCSPWAAKSSTRAWWKCPWAPPCGRSWKKLAAAITGGKKFKAAQTGGPSGGCIPASLIDTPIDYDNLMEIGSMMGSGGLIVMDEDTLHGGHRQVLPGVHRGRELRQVHPLPRGHKRLLELLEKITSGNGTMRDLERIEELAQFIKENSLCGPGPDRPEPGALHPAVLPGRVSGPHPGQALPAGVCKALLTYKIDETKCRGCTLCARACPAGAINGSVRNPHNIDTLKCVKCGACMETCRFGAISKG